MNPSDQFFQQFVRKRHDGSTKLLFLDLVAGFMRGIRGFSPGTACALLIAQSSDLFELRGQLNHDRLQI